MPSSHLILCHFLLLLPSIFPRIRVFSKESVLQIGWPKYWSFSFSISPSNAYSGLISFLSCCHCLQVVLTLRGSNLSTSQLMIIDYDPVSLHGFFHSFKSICGYLVAQEDSASTFDHHTHLSLMAGAHFLSYRLTENLINNMDFYIVIACSQSPQLEEASFLSPCWDFIGVSLQHPSVLLTMLLVLCAGIAFSQELVYTHLQGFLQVFGIHWDDTFWSHPNRTVVKHSLDGLLLRRLNITFI